MLVCMEYCVWNKTDVCMYLREQTNSINPMYSFPNVIGYSRAKGLVVCKDESEYILLYEKWQWDHANVVV